MIKDNTIYFILSYCEVGGCKREARVLPLGRSNNLLGISEWYGAIKNELGDVARLEIIHLAPSKKIAYDTCNDWNETYKNENHFFGGY